MSDAALNLVTTSGFSGYALLDFGCRRKLERFGSIIVDRPEPQALWSPRMPKSEWRKAHAAFSASGEDDEKGKWRIDKPVPELARRRTRRTRRHHHAVQAFRARHLGLFPEQYPHWMWMLDHLRRVEGEAPRVLNLFGYTGAASLIASKAGAEVTHIDASRRLWRGGARTRPLRSSTPPRFAGSSMMRRSSSRGRCAAGGRIT